jgi:alpha-tubulin suppressor-like RCC1 family protein
MHKCVVGIVAAILSVTGSAIAGPAVRAGSQHAAVLTDGGVIWAWGGNGSGQVGDGTNVARRTPVQLLSMTGVTAIAAGSDNTYALKTDGTVWAWGGNLQGQIGDGTTSPRWSPVQVSGLANVIAIAAGATHAVALESDGTVWTWGDNAYGQIGDGTTTDRHSPVQVTSLGTNVIAIGADANNSRAVQADGTVWSWGDNQYGSIGDGTTTGPRKTPVQTSTLINMAAADGGSYHGFAWDVSGTLSAWGDNTYGQLGDGTTTRRLSPVAPGVTGVVAAHGAAHSIIAKSDGTADPSPNVSPRSM